MDAVLVGVLEDDAAIRRLVTEGLRLRGHDAFPLSTGAEALQSFGTDSGVDVIVLDIGLPDADGRHVCAALRDAGQRAPVLFLTARDETHERLAAFAAGADDYLAKPFDLVELVARVEALGRRSGSDLSATPGLALDASRHAARSRLGEVLLTPTEFRILAAICARGEAVARRHSVVAAGWPDGAEISDNTVDSSLRRVRSKLAAIGSPVRIETIRGVGFRLSHS